MRDAYCGCTQQEVRIALAGLSVSGIMSLMKESLGHLLELAGILPRETDEEKEYKHAAFMLHQAAESFYGTVLLVYTNYKPKTHDLDTLRRLAANHDPAFFTVFPLRTKQERDRFDKLRQAYVGARYHDDYKITPQELKYLARCVELLRDQTETSCNNKMETFLT